MVFHTEFYFFMGNKNTFFKFWLEDEMGNNCDKRSLVKLAFVLYRDKYYLRVVLERFDFREGISVLDHTARWGTCLPTNTSKLMKIA